MSGRRFTFTMEEGLHERLDRRIAVIEAREGLKVSGATVINAALRSFLDRAEHKDRGRPE